MKRKPRTTADAATTTAPGCACGNHGTDHNCNGEHSCDDPSCGCHADATADGTNTATAADAKLSAEKIIRAATARIVELETQLESTEAHLNDTTAKLTEYLDGWRRAQADLDNYRRRTERDRDELAKFSAQRIVTNLLPVVDNLDLALKSAEAAAAASPEAAAVRDGIALIHKQFGEVLAKEGVTPIAAAGQPFDPEFHEAVMRVDTDEYPDGTVLLDLRRGWTMHGRTLRATMCQVSRQP